MKEVTKRHKSFCKAYRASEGVKEVKMDLKGLTRGPVVLQWAYRGSRGSSECLHGVQRVLRRLTWVQRSLIGLTWGPKGPQKGWRGPEGLRGVQMDLKGLT